jgi:hypothetical protein
MVVVAVGEQVSGTSQPEKLQASLSEQDEDWTRTSMMYSK